MLQRLTAGKSVIRAEGLSARDPMLCTMNLFSDATVSAESLLRICGEDMLPMDTRTYEFHRSGISLLASAGTADADADARVYTVQMEDPSKNIAARLVMWRTDATASTTASYIGCAGSGWILLKYICSDAGQDQREWDEVESHDIQPPFIALILGGWRFLEEGASNRKGLRRQFQRPRYAVYWRFRSVSHTTTMAMVTVADCGWVTVMRRFAKRNAGPAARAHAPTFTGTSTDRR